jgi:hypothetical protein
VGLWDDFTVRLLSLANTTTTDMDDNTYLQEVLQIHLSTDEGEEEEIITTTTTTTTHQEG